MSNAWKDHERKVASHFGVKRRARGADFGQSDIEIIVAPGEYSFTLTGFGKKDIKIVNSVPILVECKYRKKLGIVDSFRDHYNNSSSNTIPILRIGTHLFCDLEDFPYIYSWLEAIYTKDMNNVINLSLYFNIKTLNNKLPTYISEYIQQAKNYTEKITEYENTIPLACITSYRSNNRVVCFDTKDIPLLAINPAPAKIVI
jgi:hypothetical protein